MPDLMAAGSFQHVQEKEHRPTEQVGTHKPKLIGSEETEIGNERMNEGKAAIRRKNDGIAPFGPFG